MLNVNEKLQFKALYRQFLFRMVDLELLSSSAQGDISKLLGQIAGMLIFFSTMLSLGGMLFDGRGMTRLEFLTTLWSIQHFLISTTMLVVGMFAILSWDTTFPDRRDVLILAPLPVRPRTLFFAKVAALGAALGTGVASLNGLAGLVWPALHFVPPDGNVLRTLLAYWVSVSAAGIFVMCCVLSVQGLAAELLPRRHFLRVSAILQLGALCLFLAGYFLEPSLESPPLLLDPANQHRVLQVPTYWFWGLFQTLNGPLNLPGVPAAPRELWSGLAARALLALAISVTGSATAFVLAYFRTIRRIVEEPDIVPGSRASAPFGSRWLPRFGSSPMTAVVQFSIRTLLRSRQHRLLLVFFLGIGLSFLVLLAHSRPPGDQLGPEELYQAALIVSSLVMMCCMVVGMRVVFSRPLEIRANWIFRIAGLSAAADCQAACRRSLFVLAVLPAWAISAAALLPDFPWRMFATHLVALALLASIAVEATIYNFRKIPFTCTYLPGKSRANFLILAGYGFLTVIFQAAQFEMTLLPSAVKSAELIMALAAAAALAYRYSREQAKLDPEGVQFEDKAPDVILRLGLNRDGAPV